MAPLALLPRTAARRHARRQTPLRGSVAGSRRLYVMRAGDALATATASYAIPLLVLVTTGSTALTGVAFLLEWTPRLAAFTVAGRLVDRRGAVRVFRAVNLVRAAGVAVAAALLVVLPGTGVVTMLVVLCFGSVSGLLAEVSFVAVETVGAEASRQAAQPHHVQAVQAGIDQGGVLIGPLLGGALLLAGPSVLLGVVCVLSLAAALGVHRTHLPAEKPATGSSSGLLTGWRTVWRTRKLLWLVGGVAASNLAVGVLQAAAPITVLNRYHHSTVAVGTVWSAAAVASLMAVTAARRAIDRWQAWPVGAAAAALATAACAGTALAPGFASYTAAVALTMAGDGALTVVLRTLRSQLIPPAAFGSTLAVTIILILAPMPVAGALIAAIPAAGLPRLMAACTLLQGLALRSCFTGLRRHHPPVPPPAMPPPAEAVQSAFRHAHEA